MLFSLLSKLLPLLFQIEADFCAVKGNCGATFLGSFKVLYTGAILTYIEKFGPKVHSNLAKFGNGKFLFSMLCCGLLDF